MEWNPKRPRRIRTKRYNRERGYWKKRQYPWKGLSVNGVLCVPDSPGDWIDAETCQVCGAKYKHHRGDYDWGKAIQRLRAVAEEGGQYRDGAGYISRRPVLWALHVLKLESWYLAHQECGYSWMESRGCEEMCGDAHDEALGCKGGTAVQDLDPDACPWEGIF